MLLFTNMLFSCEHGGEVVSAWEMFNGHIYPVIMSLYYVI